MVIINIFATKFHINRNDIGDGKRSPVGNVIVQYCLWLSPEWSFQPQTFGPWDMECLIYKLKNFNGLKAILHVTLVCYSFQSENNRGASYSQWFKKKSSQNHALSEAVVSHLLCLEKKKKNKKSQTASSFWKEVSFLVTFIVKIYWSLLNTKISPCKRPLATRFIQSVQTKNSPFFLQMKLIWIENYLRSSRTLDHTISSFELCDTDFFDVSVSPWKLKIGL